MLLHSEGHLWVERAVLLCRAQGSNSDADSWDLVQKCKFCRERVEFQYGDLFEQVILCDSTDHLPVVLAPSPHCDLVWPPSLLTLAF